MSDIRILNDNHSFSRWIRSLLLMPAVLFSLTVAGQNSDEPAELSRVFFLKNCTVVRQPGVTLTGQSVIIRNGLIEDVGPNLKIPFNAQVVDTDSMFVYAGFIDAFSNTGIAKPEQKERPKVQDPDNPPMDVAGITPQILAADLYKPNDKSVGEMRAAGFTMSHVAPRGLMLPGRSALMSLGEGDADRMVVRKSVSQTGQFASTRGVYPSTVIAVIAKFRELFRNAANAGAHEELYKTNPAGINRPEYSKEVLALYPLTKKQESMYFTAPKVKDLHRALALRDELGFNMILAEVKQGWTLMDRIQKTNTPVLLSVDLPDEDKKAEKKDKKEDAKPEEVKKEEKEEKKDKEAESKDVKSPEQEAFDTKKAQALKEYVSQAAEFEKKGIAFGFSFLDVKPGDIKKNIRRMMDHGLSEKAALSALTTYPAALLGVASSAGTVEKGKLANLVITDKSYFDEKSVVRFVFVDGRKYEYNDKAKKKSEDTKQDNVKSIAGKWSYEVEVPGQSSAGTMRVSKEAGNYKILVANENEPSKEREATDVSVEGNKLSFRLEVDMNNFPLKLDFNLTMDTKNFSGSVSVGQFGSFPVKGELIDGPDMKL
jgi:imidazolonepropionase-like amidohydrolase